MDNPSQTSPETPEDGERLLRLNVAAILQNAEGKILICERLHTPGAWQFPQGGVDKGETLEEALARELVEEICVKPKHYRLLEGKGPYRYLYGDGRKVKGFHGKEQHFFLAEFSGPESAVDVKTRHPEFRAARWVMPQEFDVAWLPAMKRAVYQAVFMDFFRVAI